MSPLKAILYFSIFWVSGGSDPDSVVGFGISMEHIADSAGILSFWVSGPSSKKVLSTAKR
eukprot:3688626-Alexandrium_andersonii.AAC.1